jgi:hypothetical protein
MMAVCLCMYYNLLEQTVFFDNRITWNQLTNAGDTVQ